MADNVDLAAQIEGEHLALGLQRISRTIPVGVAGECDGCGETMPRLVEGRCGFCRDGRLPPPGWEPPVTNPFEDIPVMAVSKSITFVATGAVLEEIKRRTADGTSNNRAALDLLEGALNAAKPAPAVIQSSVSAEPLSNDELFDLLRARLNDDRGRAHQADLVADQAETIAHLEQRVASAETRATAAEGRLSVLRSALNA